MLEQQHSQRMAGGPRQGGGGGPGGAQGGVYPGAPFFYSPQQMPPQPQGARGFMYPQQMMMRPGPGVYQPMGQMANYGAMAMNRGQQQGAGRQGGGQGRKGGQQGGQ